MLAFNIIGIFCIYGANVTYIPAAYYTSAVTATIFTQLGPTCTYVLVIIMKMERKLSQIWEKSMVYLEFLEFFTFYLVPFCNPWDTT